VRTKDENLALKRAEHKLQQKEEYEDELRKKIEKARIEEQKPSFL